MCIFDDFYKELNDYLSELDGKFLSSISPTDPPEKYELEVRAYCILAHAAFEEYFEKVASNVMDMSINNWLQPEPKLNDVLLTLATYSGEKLIYTDGKNISPYQQMKNILEDARKKLSHEIHENHGISIKNQMKILLPVSLQIKEDINLQNSLDQLVKQRGVFAHKGKIKSVLSPEDAKVYVSDCLLICADLREKAKNKFV